VVNTAKYLSGQPLLAFNLTRGGSMRAAAVPRQRRRPRPRPGRERRLRHPPITMGASDAEQWRGVYGVNDLFIGQRTHVRHAIVSASAGRRKTSPPAASSCPPRRPTGWFRSILTGAAAVVRRSLPSHPSVSARPVPLRLGGEPPLLQRPRAVRQQGVVGRVGVRSHRRGRGIGGDVADAAERRSSAMVSRRIIWNSTAVASLALGLRRCD
jgi:hypothetical protein